MLPCVVDMGDAMPICAPLRGPQTVRRELRLTNHPELVLMDQHNGWILSDEIHLTVNAEALQELAQNAGTVGGVQVSTFGFQVVDGGPVKELERILHGLTNAECAEAFTILRDPERAVQLAARGLAA